MNASTTLDDLAAIKRVHLLGICGTAMAALAGALQAQGRRVTGTDEHVYPPMSDQLAALGIAFSEGYRAENIPEDTDLVVVGNVIRATNLEAQAMRARGLPFLSMAEAVRRFAIGDKHCVAMVGTHGKTTTTSLAAHLLVELGLDPGFLIGGIARNFGSNFREGKGSWFVVEGDEYDTAYFDKTPKFFKYNARTVIFTSLEFDHADIYTDLAAIRSQFSALLEQLPEDGLLIACSDDENVRGLLSRAPCRVLRYGFGPQAACRLSDWHVEGEEAVFTLTQPGGAHTWRSPMAGRHNAFNAAAVIVLATEQGHAQTAIQAALSSFQGVKRRQEVRGEEGGVLVLDDFAHHPTAVTLTIEAIRARYPGRRLWAVFEPRSFTARSARFQAEFQRAFSGADRVLFATPFVSDYSAGVARLDTAALAAGLTEQGVPAWAEESTDALLEHLCADCATGDVVLVMSNGGFDNLHERLLSCLRERPSAAAASASPQAPKS